LGLPDTLEKVDGAMRWGYNDKTYFFSGKDLYISIIDTFKSIEAFQYKDILTIFRRLTSHELEAHPLSVYSVDIQEQCTGGLMKKSNT
jgi:hypothetical protein